MVKTRSASDITSIPMVNAHMASNVSVGWLRVPNFTVARVQLGRGPFVSLYLQPSAHWNPAQIGAALAFGNVLQVVVQTPVGASIDRYAVKRALIAAATIMVALGCGALLVAHSRPVVWASQGLIGLSRAVFPPALSAVTLGMFGRAGMDKQTGISQAFMPVAVASRPSASASRAMSSGCRRSSTSHWCSASRHSSRRRASKATRSTSKAARRNEGDATQRPSDSGGYWQAVRNLFTSLVALARDRRVRRFLVCEVLFYIADVAMVPLVTQVIGKGQGARRALVLTSAYVVASQILFIGIAALCGRLSSSLGRKPLLLFAFAALAVRACLYAASDNPIALLAVQWTDAFSTGVFGVVGVLFISDFTQNTGRFNAALGAVATFQGIGAFLSNAIAGHLATAAGTHVTFLVLAAVAVVGFVVALTVPETRDLAAQPNPSNPSGPRDQAEPRPAGST